jgi:hypothetical protein
VPAVAFPRVMTMTRLTWRPSQKIRLSRLVVAKKAWLIDPVLDWDLPLIIVDDIKDSWKNNGNLYLSRSFGPIF